MVATTDATAPGWIDFHAGPPGGNATRHLQAAAYLNREFRDRVITELVEERHRVPAPAPGTDTGAVLMECLRARRHTLWAALACFVVLLVGSAFSRTGAAVSLTAVLSVLFYGGLARLVVALAVRVFPALDTPARRATLRRAALAVLVLGFSAMWAAIVAALATASSSDSGPFGGGGFLGSSNGYGPYPGYDRYASGSDTSGLSWQVPLAMLALWILIGTLARFLRHQRLAVIGDQKSAEPGGQPPASLRQVFQRLRSGAPEAETVYGDFEPFVGSGVAREEWAVSAELRPASVETPPGTLAVPQAHEFVTAWLRGLASGTAYQGDALHSVTVQDRVFRSGLRVEPHEHWFGGLSPEDQDGRRVLQADWVREMDETAHPRLRHYVEARAELWHGQVVASTFVRVTLQGHQLYVEGLEYLLPPVDERYRTVDMLLPPDGFDLLRAFWAATTNLGRDFADYTLQVGSTVRSLVRGWLRRRWRERMLSHGRKVQHAPRVSVRELGADDRYEVLFQHLDAQRVWAAVRERTLAAVVALLKQEGYDTTEIEASVRHLRESSGLGAERARHATVPVARLGTS
ncbi:hypothetical protein ABIA32_001296 [Streptacidiphilus sp. MAP12-20]|uniref:hypothetical protein n=1 Tax=Streptacidiphilus sp. MAP12-20 TaxID=3156299 RepID=UPI0035157D74